MWVPLLMRHAFILGEDLRDCFAVFLLIRLYTYTYLYLSLAAKPVFAL